MSQLILSTETADVDNPGTGKASIYLKDGVVKVKVASATALEVVSDIGASIHASDEKTSIASADEFIISDSADTNIQKKVTGTTLKAVITSQFYLSAGGGIPTTTAGCSSPTTIETTTYKQNIKVLDFDTGSDENANWSFALPSDYGGGTVTAKFYWLYSTGTGTNVTWAIKAMSYGNSDALDQAYGTPQSVTDALETAGDITISAATSALTIAGTPSAGDFVVFCVYRDVSEDDLSADARLVGVQITYTRS